MLVRGDGETGRIVDVERHPAIPHQPEVGADTGAHLGQFGDVLVETLDALGGAVVQRQLPADEAEFLCDVRPRAGGVELQLVADRAAEHVIDRLAAQLAQQVPQRQIDAGNGVHHQALATIILGREVHLVPDLLVFGRAPALEKAGEVLLDDVAGGLAASGHRKANRAVLGLDLDDQRAEHVDAEALPRLAIFGVAAHRRRDVIVDPVPLALVMIIGAAATDGIGAHMLDLGESGYHGSTLPFWRPSQMAGRFPTI